MSGALDVGWARVQVDRLLAGLPHRRAHIVAVGRTAERITHVVSPLDRELLVVAAHLHDIGYAPASRPGGVHQLDGAGWLRGLGHERLACTVAHHSESRCELGLRGFGEELATYERDDGPLRDALVYCDMTTGPSGEPMTIEERLAEVEVRYGDGVLVDALRKAPAAGGSGATHRAAVAGGREDRLWAVGEVVVDAAADRA